MRSTWARLRSAPGSPRPPAKGGTSQLNYTVNPAGATLSGITFSVSNNTIATISGNGLITALNNGIVTISGFVNGNAAIKFNVKLVITGQLTFIENDIVSTIHIFPNPATELVNVVLSEGNIRTISLINSIGSEVVKLVGDTSSINISGYPKGIYILKIITSKGMSIKPIRLD